MSVNLTSANGEVNVNVSNGEWYAITKMAEAFNIDGPWTGNHDSGQKWTPEVLEEMAVRAEQVGDAAEYIRELARNGGVGELF